MPSAPHATAGTDRVDYLYLGHFSGWPYLVHADTGRLFYVREGTGVARPATDREFDELEAGGAVRRIVLTRHCLSSLLGQGSLSDVEKAAALDAGVEKTLLQIVMLDEAAVANGFKAISIFLFENWIGSLVERFGPHDNPHTIRSWRATRGSPGSRNAIHMVRLSGRVHREPRGDGIAQEALQRHSFDVLTTGAAVRSVYAAYRAEMFAINDARHVQLDRRVAPFRIASEATMQRRVRYLRSFAQLADRQDEVAHPTGSKLSHEPRGDVPDANKASGFCGRGPR